jgi:hypothetical protein
MSEISVTEFIDVRERARALALPDVDDLALLPLGFLDAPPSGPTIHQEATTIRKLLREADVAIQVLGEAPDSQTTILKSADWIAPIVFVSAGLWSQNALAVQVAIDVIGSYATDMFKGVLPTKPVKLSIAVESTKGRSTKLLTYEGPAEGLGTIADAIERIANE